MGKLLKYFKGYWTQLILGPTFKLAEAILELMVPLIMARIIDVGIAGANRQAILYNGFLMLVLAVFGVVFGIVCQYFAARVSQGFGRVLRKNVFQHVFSLSSSQCNALGTDTLITRCTNDVNQVQTGVNMFIRLATRAPFLAIGSIVMALITNWKLGLIFLISTPIIAFVLYYVTVKSLPMYAKMQKKQDDISRITSENLAGVRVIRAFGRQKTEEQEFAQTGDEFAVLTMRVGKLSAALNPVTFFVVNVAIIAIIYFGTGYVQIGSMPVGELLAMVNYMNATLLALIVLANVIVIFNKALASAKRVSDILEIKPEMDDTTTFAKIDENAPVVQFENVNYGFTDGADLAIKNVNFTLNSGENLGVIGGTGSGKSTLIKLLQRFYDATNGTIYIGGVDIQKMPQKQLNSLIGYVPQQTVLFSGTIESNLRIAKQTATVQELWNALNIAQAETFVKEKKDGLQTIVQEGAKNFSGGQKQRLTIARAVLQNAKILILDDAFSALDFATDAALRNALEKKLTDTTKIIVSQRASSIKKADVILVLAEGEVVGVGTHEQLLQSCVVYHEICLSQGVLQEEGVK